MPRGRIRSPWKNGFTFIQPDDGGADAFAHVTRIADGQPHGEYTLNSLVEYDVEDGPKGPVAVEIRLIEAGTPEGEVAVVATDQQGVISKWFGGKGYGFATTDRGDVFVHQSSLTPGSGVLEAGCVVEFDTVEGANRPEARSLRVVGWQPTGDKFHDFAQMPGTWADTLAGMAETENWDYRFTESSTTKPILRSYLRYTFLRLSETGRVVTGDGHTGFNTGLVDHLQREIIAVFRPLHAGAERLTLEAFYFEGDRQLLHYFGAEQPRLATYFDDPTQLIYDHRLPLYLAVDHVDERLARAPEELRDNPHGFIAAINGQRDNIMKRVARNYKTAIPHFYRPHGGQGQLQLLLPLTLVRPDRVDLALAVERIRDTYRANTVLTLDMAYTNARLITRPDTEWLRPEPTSGGVAVRGTDPLEVPDVAEV